MSQRLAPILLLTLGLWWRLAPFAPAWAHSELLSADPAPGAQLAASPDKIHLTFTAPLTPFSTLMLYGAQFQIIPGLTPVIAAGNPQHMVAAIPSLAPGVYTVQWRAISTDKDLVTGSYQFVVVGHTGHNRHLMAISGVAVLFLTLAILVGLTKWQGWKGFYRRSWFELREAKKLTLMGRTGLSILLWAMLILLPPTVHPSRLDNRDAQAASADPCIADMPMAMGFPLCACMIDVAPAQVIPAFSVCAPIFSSVYALPYHLRMLVLAPPSPPPRTA